MVRIRLCCENYTSNVKSYTNNRTTACETRRHVVDRSWLQPVREGVHVQAHSLRSAGHSDARTSIVMALLIVPAALPMPCNDHRRRQWFIAVGRNSAPSSYRPVPFRPPTQSSAVHPALPAFRLSPVDKRAGPQSAPSKLGKTKTLW